MKRFFSHYIGRSGLRIAGIVAASVAGLVIYVSVLGYFAYIIQGTIGNRPLPGPITEERIRGAIVNECGFNPAGEGYRDCYERVLILFALEECGEPDYDSARQVDAFLKCAREYWDRMGF